MPVMILTGLLVVASVYDIRTMKIPLWLAVMHMLPAVLAVAADLLINDANIRDYIPTIIVVFMIVSAALFMRLSGADAAGSADGLLMIAICLVIKAEKAILTLGMAFILAGLFAGFLMMIKKAGRKSRIPFIPFLTVGLLLCLIVTDTGDIQFI